MHFHEHLQEYFFVSNVIYITKVTLPIYSEGSNECTFIPRNKFLTLHFFYMSKVYNRISRNFFNGYKMLQNRKNRQKTGEILMKSLGWFRHCKQLYYIND